MTRQTVLNSYKRRLEIKNSKQTIMLNQALQTPVSQVIVITVEQTKVTVHKAFAQNRGGGASGEC